MIKASSAIIVMALGVVALSACQQQSAAAPLDVRATMQQHVNPATLAIWDIGNNAMNDDGGLDAALLDDAKWTALADSAGQLSAAAKELAGGTSFIASSPDNTQVNEGEIAMSEIQKHLDADPKGFSELAASLAQHADGIVAAAKAKDAAKAGELVSQLDTVCESCHSRFWYPGQQ